MSLHVTDVMTGCLRVRGVSPTECPGSPALSREPECHRAGQSRVSRCPGCPGCHVTGFVTGATPDIGQPGHHHGAGRAGRGCSSQSMSASRDLVTRVTRVTAHWSQSPAIPDTPAQMATSSLFIILIIINIIIIILHSLRITLNLLNLNVQNDKAISVSQCLRALSVSAAVITAWSPVSHLPHTAAWAQSVSSPQCHDCLSQKCNSCLFRCIKYFLRST